MYGGKHREDREIFAAHMGDVSQGGTDLRVNTPPLWMDPVFSSQALDCNDIYISQDQVERLVIQPVFKRHSSSSGLRKEKSYQGYWQC